VDVAGRVDVGSVGGAPGAGGEGIFAGTGGESAAHTGGSAGSSTAGGSFTGTGGIFAGTGGNGAAHTGGSAGSSSGPLDAAAEGDGSPCAVFQPAFVWTRTSTSFTLGYGHSMDFCHSGQYVFSKANRTLSGPICIGGPNSPTILRLVPLTQTQFDAVIEQVGTVQTVCEGYPYCNYARVAWSLQVYNPESDVSPTTFEGCLRNVDGDASVTPTPAYVNLDQLSPLLTTLSSIIEAACDPDAGGGDPAVCVPLPLDSAATDAAASN